MANHVKPLTGTSPMPYGQYKGIKMTNVPPKYLTWLYRNNKVTQAVKLYIEDNIEAIKKETSKLKTHERTNRK